MKNPRKNDTNMHISFFIFHSHGNSNNDNWNGFDNDFENSSYQSAGNQEPQAGSINTSNTTKTEKLTTIERGDFSTLDVKASKPTKTNKAKSIEDDAWNLLNN